MNKAFILLCLLLSTNIYGKTLEGKWCSDAKLSNNFNSQNEKLSEKQLQAIYQIQGNMVLQFFDGVMTAKTPQLQISLEDRTVELEPDIYQTKYKTIKQNGNDIQLYQWIDDGWQKTNLIHFVDDNTIWESSAFIIKDKGKTDIREYFIRCD